LEKDKGLGEIRGVMTARKGVIIDFKVFFGRLAREHNWKLEKGVLSYSLRS
jgi:hypothetical protein